MGLATLGHKSEVSPAPSPGQEREVRAAGDADGAQTPGTPWGLPRAARGLLHPLLVPRGAYAQRHSLCNATGGQPKRPRGQFLPPPCWVGVTNTLSYAGSAITPPVGELGGGCNHKTKRELRPQLFSLLHTRHEGVMSVTRAQRRKLSL